MTDTVASPYDPRDDNDYLDSVLADQAPDDPDNDTPKETTMPDTGPASTADDFDDPAELSAKFNATDREGHLLLITPLGVEDVLTSFGESQVLRADVVDLDTVDAPEELRNAGIFQKKIKAQLQDKVGTGRPVLGRLTRGTASNGMSAPWQLAPATERDKQAAREWRAGATF